MDYGLKTKYVMYEFITSSSGWLLILDDRTVSGFLLIIIINSHFHLLELN